MARTAENSTSMAADLARRLANLVAAAKAEGRAEALAELRQLVAGGAAPAKRGPGRPKGSRNKPKAGGTAKAAKSGKKRKNPWAALSAEQRLARVNAIRKGRGLAPKTA